MTADLTSRAALWLRRHAPERLKIVHPAMLDDGFLHGLHRVDGRFDGLCADVLAEIERAQRTRCP
jgi:hypothetical protein